MASKYIQKFAVPDSFPDLISNLTTEVLRNQPEDIIDFAIEYFRCLQEGVILDYPKKGKNLPCDFRPEIPVMGKKPIKKREIQVVVQMKDKSQVFDPQLLKESKEDNKADDNQDEQGIQINNSNQHEAEIQTNEVGNEQEDYDNHHEEEQEKQEDNEEEVQHGAYAQDYEDEEQAGEEQAGEDQNEEENNNNNNQEEENDESNKDQ